MDVVTKAPNQDSVEEIVNRVLPWGDWRKRGRAPLVTEALQVWVRRRQWAA